MGVEVTKFARQIDAIPLVKTTAERGVRFPSPSDGQRVQNLETGAIERFSIGLGWLVDLIGGGGGGGGLTLGQTDARYYQKTESDTRYITPATANATYALLGHNHDALYYTKAAADLRYAALVHNHDAVYAPISHNHNTLYYTQAQADARYEPLGGGGQGATPIASASILGKVKTDVTEADPVVYTKTTVDTLLAGKAALAHSHVATDITSGTIAGARIGTGTRDGSRFLRDDNVWATIALSGGPGLATTTNSGTVKTDANAGDPVVYLKTSVDTLLAGRAAVSHVHAGTDITSGVVAPARLGSGTPDSSVFLRGDGAWASPGSGSYLPVSGGFLTGTTYIYSSTQASTRANDDPNTPGSGPVFKLMNQAASARKMSFYPDEGIFQIGQTPTQSQWPRWENNFSAPVGSGGPIKLPRYTDSIYLFGESINMFANMAPQGGTATSGPNQQTGIGRNGTSSQGKLRQATFGVSGDGGFRFQSNYTLLPIFQGVGTVAKTSGSGGDGGVVTFSDANHGAQVGNAIYVVGDNAKQTSLMQQLSATTFKGNNTLAWSAVGPFEVHGGQQLDTNRGSIKWGTDSAGNVFGVQYVQPGSSSFAGKSYGDFDLLIYPGGWDTADMGHGERVDIGVKGKAQSLSIFTGNVDIPDDRKKSVVFHPHFGTTYGIYNGGNVEFYGQIRAWGGYGEGLAPFNLRPQQGAGYHVPAALENGDMWTNNAGVFIRLGGANYQFNLSAV